MRQCRPAAMFGDSRPNRAFTMRATCPAGTIGTAGLAAALEGGVAGGSATGCDAGGVSCNGFGFADGGGASTPEDAPGGIKFWLPPIAPGGRGTSLKPGGMVWAEAEQARPSANAIVARSRQRCARSDGKLMLRFIAENSANSSREGGLSRPGGHA